LKVQPDEPLSNCASNFSLRRYSEEVKLLPCLHGYHPGCIDPWLAERANCPLCKHDITPAAADDMEAAEAED